ncbi:MAG: F0F1 ATP synthase subunit A [Prevotellaceae bacterium]|jgi:F-type H+-transporting ATPase subunit a|nr:F0F1 ATP synthase subunit A [Prevotellaceae bacterium]
MKRRIIVYVLFLFVAWTTGVVSAHAQKTSMADVKELVYEHIYDAYEWHITKIEQTDVTIPLPVILYSKQSGWHVFLSSRLKENGGVYQGFYIAGEGSSYARKLVEKDAQGVEIKPLDISVTKDVLALLMSSALLIALVLFTARWYRRKQATDLSPGGFVGFMEMFVMMVYDDVIKDNIGQRYRKFAPLLLTQFFFILINNYMGLIPFFPGGANITGNITITFVLAAIAMVAINLFGRKSYWKDIFWPNVPMLLKCPVPFMQLIELMTLFIRPFVLMMRLFANMLSGHISVTVLLSLVFISASYAPAMQGGLSLVGVFFSIFMNALEVLVAFVQAYVFTLLTAAFIGMAQVDEESETKITQ